MEPPEVNNKENLIPHGTKGRESAYPLPVPFRS